jgi:pseudaminic acid cytidylyltransferase
VRTICIIPARSGSKRIPKKNIKLFNGKPIITYSIRTALESELFDKVIISTDSEEIAELAEKNGAEAPFLRPSKYASDTATTAEVIVHALSWYKNHSEFWDIACCLYPTAPFCRPDDLNKGLNLLKSKNAPAVIPVCEFPYPILRSLKINNNGKIEMNWPEYELTRSQDLHDAYHDAGQFYWIRVSKFNLNPRLMPVGTLPLVLPRSRVVDIDTPNDWEYAETLYKVLDQ